MNNPAILRKHLIVKWNPKEIFHEMAPDTIRVHCNVLRHFLSNPAERYVWWGKVSKSGNLGIPKEIALEINKQIEIENKDTYLYLYCPDAEWPSLHVGKLVEISINEPNDDMHKPKYYNELNYKIPFWFKLTDIRKISLKDVEGLLVDEKNYYDPVSSNFYPLVVYEAEARTYFLEDCHFLSELEGQIMTLFEKVLK